jgi:hypothetical protein
MRRSAPLLILVAALALGACGGGSDTKTNASTTTATTPGSTTGASGASGATGAKKGHQKSRGKSSTGGSKANGGNGGGGGKTSTGSAPPPAKTNGTQTKPPSQGTTPTPANISPAKTAKTVCSQFLPEAIKRDIKRGKITKKKVATQYAKGYPKEQRSEAYKGCLAGLNKIA